MNCIQGSEWCSGMTVSPVSSFMGHGGSGAGMESLVLGRWFLAPRQHNLATLRWDEKYEMGSKWRAVPLLPCCNFTHCFTIRLWKVSAPRQIDLWSLSLGHLWWIFRLLGLSSFKAFIWLCFLLLANANLFKNWTCLSRL